LEPVEDHAQKTSEYAHLQPQDEIIKILTPLFSTYAQAGEEWPRALIVGLLGMKCSQKKTSSMLHAMFASLNKS
jgi:hypothetical protein